MTDTTATREPDGVRHPPHLMWGAGLLSVAVALMLLAGWVIGGGRPDAFDRAILLALRVPGSPSQPVGPAGFRQTVIDITTLGGGTVLTLVVFLTVGMLLASRKWLTAALVGVATLSGSFAVSLLKDSVARSRPDVVPHLVEVNTLSFPSGHAANSAIIYLTVATLLTQIIQRDARRTYLFAVAILLVGAIGVSRVYLGVHWPSDVLAGWSFGTLWAVAWWRLGKWLRIHQRELHALPADEDEAL
ncbi:phosphatase PAP2 family protein [Stakelama saccharophila]|uniref:Phosphatase PAP2 family protein n=1 Tax=Stakelama saccharophila TaxID=3075605 RepID=A0ABZ0BAM7_9SPHN|nr:phosphatase PAP2 family protein [Stakelama sp. W311]WNO54472.1 phosphatase PAP2 family protein [Stakelama sp. W311]